MASEKKTRAQLSATLKRARSEHKQLTKKFATAKAKLEKRTQKLKRLESKIATAERHAYLRGIAEGAQTAQDDQNLRPARLIYNPKSSGASNAAQSLEAIVALLRAHGIRAEVGIKTSGKVARQMAKTAADNREALVIVAGGDGTIEDVASQLVGTRTALGIIPTGTSNNLARSLGIPLDLDDACALLGAGSTRHIDVGTVVSDEKPQVNYFLETAGLGLIAIAFPAGQAVQKGKISGLPGALRKLFGFKPDQVEIILDGGETFVVNSQLVTVSNAPLTALNYLIAPEAKMDDGLLDIAVYDGMSKTDLLNYFMAIQNATRVHNPNVRFYRARQVRIRSGQAMPVISDKDEIPGQKVLDIKVMPQALTMVVGKGIALNLPVEAVHSALPLSGPAKPPNENGAVPLEPKPDRENGPAPDGSGKA